MNEYVSSIINLYADSDKVKEDSKALNEIIDRQGINLLLHVISDYIGSNAIKYNMTYEDTTRIKESLIKELRDSINERT